jgi:hypothetical protein
MDENHEDSLHADIRASMQIKETDELLKIWIHNDHKEWRDPVFPIVKEILLERLGELPEQEQEPQQPVQERNSKESLERWEFITGWLAANLLGWMIGIYSLSGRSWEVYSHLEINGMWQLPDAIAQILVMICIPLGLGLAILQSFMLGRWKIEKLPWILVTSIGWIIPALAFSQIRWHLLFDDPMGDGFVNYLELLWLIYPLALLGIGGGISILQAAVMGKSMTRPTLWIFANALGLLIFGWLVNGIFRMALESRFVDIITLAKRGEPLIPPYLVWPVIAAILPFLATLIIALPSGLVLWNYGTRLPEETAKEDNKAA